MTESSVINNVVIRSAGADDFEWVADLMVRALSPFYDGDHRAHARRIKRPYFDAIMSGRKTLEVRVGYDNIKRLKAGELLQFETEHTSGVARDRPAGQRRRNRSQAPARDLPCAQGASRCSCHRGREAVGQQHRVRIPKLE